MSRGFTLVEVTVALLIGGMAVAGAAALLDGLGSRAAVIERSAASADRSANTERWLRDLFANLDHGSSGAPVLTGDATAVALRTWCETSKAWLQPCNVRLSFGSRFGTNVLRLQILAADTSVIQLGKDFQTGRLRYLVTADHGGAWTESWSDLVPPVAVEVIVDRDSLLLTVSTGGY